MKTRRLVFGCIASLAAVAGAAESDGTSANRWHVTVGPAWRARVKTEISGATPVPAVSASQTTTKESGERVVVQDPVQEPAGATLYAEKETVTETSVAAGGGAAAMGATDERRPLGVKARTVYDVWQGDAISVGLGLRFAGYWNVRSSAFGAARGGSVTVRRTTDYYLYENGPYPDDGDFEFASPNAEPYLPYRETSDDETTLFASQVRGARLTADLYQIGIGPSVTWHALGWLDAYAGVAALCNIASFDMSAGAKDSSETQCRFGVAAEVGLIGYLTENFGIYGEVGYEWVDGFDTSVDGLSADVDFSSLMVSAGVVLAF